MASTDTKAFLVLSPNGGVKAGKLVQVTRVVRELNVAALEASLDTDRTFTAAEEDGSHAWHAVRIHHRSRLM